MTHEADNHNCVYIYIARRRYIIPSPNHCIPASDPKSRISPIEVVSPPSSGLMYRPPSSVQSLPERVRILLAISGRFDHQPDSNRLARLAPDIPDVITLLYLVWEHNDTPDVHAPEIDSDAGTFFWQHQLILNKVAPHSGFTCLCHLGLKCCKTSWKQKKPSSVCSTESLIRSWNLELFSSM